MNTFSHKDGLFMPSGCLSPEAMEKYAAKMLPPEEMKLVDEHLASCAFCRDAVEGASQIPDFAAHSSVINERLRSRFRYIPGRRRKSPPISNFLLPAAASVIVLVGIIAWFHYFYPEKQELALVTDSLPIQGDDLEMHEKAAPNTAEPNKGEAVTIGGVMSREGDKSADDTADHKKEVTAEPEKEKPLEHVAVENDLIADADMEEVYEDETITEEELVEVIEMQEKADTGHIVSDMAVAKKSAATTRQMESADVALFTLVEQMPEYPGGMDSLQAFIHRHIQLPAETKIEGKVYAGFTVTKKGEVKNISIKRGLEKEIDEEVVRVLKMLPEWKPGMQRGKAVDVELVIPIIL